MLRAAFLGVMLLAALPAALQQQANDPPLFRLVWPEDGERIPAGWVEVLYSVRPPYRHHRLSFAVLIDGYLCICVSVYLAI